MKNYQRLKFKLEQELSWEVNRVFVTILFVLITSSVYAQHPTKITYNQYDSNNKKHGYWLEDDPYKFLENYNHGEQQGVSIEYYKSPSGSIYDWKNGNYFAIQMYITNNSIKDIQGDVTKNYLTLYCDSFRLHFNYATYSYEFHENGRLKSEGLFICSDGSCQLDENTYYKELILYDTLGKYYGISKTYNERVYDREDFGSNIWIGGHTGAPADAPMAFHEFMIRPIGAKNMAECVRMGAEIFHALKKVLKSRGLSTAVGDEGGFAPALKGTNDASDCIAEAIKTAGYKPGKDVIVTLDFSENGFSVKKGTKFSYDYSQLNNGLKKDLKGKCLTADEQVKYFESLCKKYPVDSIVFGSNIWVGDYTVIKDSFDFRLPIMKNNAKRDIHKLYNRDSTILTIEYRKNGKKDGHYRHYNTTTKTFNVIGEYTQNQPSGTWLLFDSNSSSLRTIIYKISKNKSIYITQKDGKSFKPKYKGYVYLINKNNTMECEGWALFDDPRYTLYRYSTWIKFSDLPKRHYYSGIIIYEADLNKTPVFIDKKEIENKIEIYPPVFSIE